MPLQHWWSCSHLSPLALHAPARESPVSEKAPPRVVATTAFRAVFREIGLASLLVSWSNRSCSTEASPSRVERVMTSQCVDTVDVRRRRRPTFTSNPNEMVDVPGRTSSANAGALKQGGSYRSAPRAAPATSQSRHELSPSRTGSVRQVVDYLRAPPEPCRLSHLVTPNGCLRSPVTHFPIPRCKHEVYRMRHLPLYQGSPQCQVNGRKCADIIVMLRLPWGRLPVVLLSREDPDAGMPRRRRS